MKALRKEVEAMWGNRWYLMAFLCAVSVGISVGIVTQREVITIYMRVLGGWVTVGTIVTIMCVILSRAPTQSAQSNRLLICAVSMVISTIFPQISSAVFVT
jgi:hypothetical protein